MATTDLFSYFPGLEVTEDELLRAELFSYQVLTAEYPDIDLREGTAIRDMVIRPTATLLALINKAMIAYWSQNSLGSATNDTPKEYVDKLLSNWFLTRKEGNLSKINVRLFFSKRKAVAIYPDVFFSPNNVEKFYTEQTELFTSDSLLYDSDQDQYYVDVNLVAETTGSQYDISSGSLLYFTNFDPYFMHGEINYLVEASKDIETNSEFIERATTAISTRNLINTPSAISLILESFSYVTDVVTVGFGDVGMVRDKIMAVPRGGYDPIWIHQGGYIDLYCKTDLAMTSDQFTADSNGDILIAGPIYKIVRRTTTAGDDPDTISVGASYTAENVYYRTYSVSITRTGSTATVTCSSHGLEVGERVTISGASQSEYNGTFTVTSVPTAYTFTYTVSGSPATPATGSPVVKYVDRSQDVGFSDKQEITVSFGPGAAGGTASFDIYYFSNLDSLRTYVEDGANRVLCADVLPRAFNSTLLDVTVESYAGVTPDSDVCSTVIETYLSGLLPGETFIMADLLALLYDAGITTIKTPLTITYNKYVRDLMAPVTGTITDVLDPNDNLHTFYLNSVTTSNVTI